MVKRKFSIQRNCNEVTCWNNEKRPRKARTRTNSPSRTIAWVRPTTTKSSRTRWARARPKGPTATASSRRPSLAIRTRPPPTTSQPPNIFRACSTFNRLRESYRDTHRGVWSVSDLQVCIRTMQVSFWTWRQHFTLSQRKLSSIVWVIFKPARTKDYLILVLSIHILHIYRWYRSPSCDLLACQNFNSSLLQPKIERTLNCFHFFLLFLDIWIGWMFLHYVSLLSLLFPQDVSEKNSVFFHKSVLFSLFSSRFIRSARFSNGLSIPPALGCDGAGPAHGSRRIG